MFILIIYKDTFKFILLPIDIRATTCTNTQPDNGSQSLPLMLCISRLFPFQPLQFFVHPSSRQRRFYFSITQP